MADLLFVLGTQRSGTTWLANIFDSHPDCLHFYEPFAPAYGIFPYFPDEFTYIEPPAARLAARLRHDLPRLIEKKSRLFDPVHATRRQFETEAWLMGCIETWSRRARLGVPPFASQFNLLHLNRIGQQPVAYFPKSDHIQLTAIKEVRLYFKLRFLAATFPDARFVHVMRHPAAVVNSMVNFLKRGRLVEIRDQIGHFTETVGAQPRFEHYRPLLERVERGTLPEKLAAYWRVANETLAADVAEAGGRALPLVYERLATDPLARVNELFAWCGLPPSPGTDDYVRASSTSRSERKTVLDTNRVSATYYKDWVGKTPADVLDAVGAVCADSPLMAEFAPYYETA
ncbi:MAG TPA: sulfotransferase [Candidatus Krumholzibacteria bacterium]